MGAEDFSFYSEVIPAGFYYFGVRNETLSSVHTKHTPYFMIDEDVLPTGAAVHADRYLAAMPFSSPEALTWSSRSCEAIQLRRQWQRIINPCTDADAKKGHG
ncbi:hypothetical protein ACQ4PT_047799 [Festuca glaucescens]